MGTITVTTVIIGVEADVNWHGGGKGPTMDLLTCPLCPATFSGHGALAAHIWNAHGGDKVSDDGLATINVNGYELSVWPWEDPQTLIDEMEAVLEEMESKPGLWFDEPLELDELEFMSTTLDTVRMSDGGANSHKRAKRAPDPLMEDIRNERFELAFVTGKTWI